MLAGGKRFTVLRREERLERLEMNGVLTATLAVEGLRVGDVLRLTISMTNRDAALRRQGPDDRADFPSRRSARGFARIRLIWPETGCGPVEELCRRSEAAGHHRGRVPRDDLRRASLAKQPELPERCAGAFRPSADRGGDELCRLVGRVADDGAALCHRRPDRAGQPAGRRSGEDRRGDAATR